MFRSVIHERPLDIVHSRDHFDICDENSDPDTAFKDCHHSLRVDKFPEDSRDQKREYHKDRNRHKDGEYHHRRHNDIIYFFTKCIDQKFLELSRLLVLLIVLKEACRPCQGTHSQDHGVRETKDSSHKRQGEKLYFFCHAHIGIFLDNDLAVRLSDSRGVIVLVLHHDTL